MIRYPTFPQSDRTMFSYNLKNYTAIYFLGEHSLGRLVTDIESLWGISNAIPTSFS